MLGDRRLGKGSCNICGGEVFQAGFEGRLAFGNTLPVCSRCKSAERHRIVFQMYRALRPFTINKLALQFAPDGSIRKAWFKRLDYSVYGGINSIDLLNITLPPGSYDMIISNHVMEHVSDDVRAMRQSLRTVGEKGIIHICAPAPSFHFRTTEWGYADPSKNLHYREYGADLGKRFTDNIVGLHAIGVFGADPVTSSVDVIFFFSLSDESLSDLAKLLQRSRHPCVFIA
jgi:SAM-dependent methyltransferase